MFAWPLAYSLDRYKPSRSICLNETQVVCQWGMKRLWWCIGEGECWCRTWRSRQYLAQRTTLNLSVSEQRVSRRLPREPEPLSRQKTVVAAYRGEIWRRGNWNVSRTPSWRPADSADSDYGGADLRKINVRFFAEFICNEIQRSTYIPAIVYHWLNFVQDLPKTNSSSGAGLD